VGSGREARPALAGRVSGAPKTTPDLIQYRREHEDQQRPVAEAGHNYRQQEGEGEQAGQDDERTESLRADRVLGVDELGAPTIAVATGSQTIVNIQPTFGTKFYVVPVTTRTVPSFAVCRP